MLHASHHILVSYWTVSLLCFRGVASRQLLRQYDMEKAEETLNNKKTQRDDLNAQKVTWASCTSWKYNCLEIPASGRVLVGPHYKYQRFGIGHQTTYRPFTCLNCSRSSTSLCIQRNAYAWGLLMMFLSLMDPYFLKTIFNWKIMNTIMQTLLISVKISSVSI